MLELLLIVGLVLYGLLACVGIWYFTLKTIYRVSDYHEIERHLRRKP